MNKVELLGRLTKAPEVKQIQTQNGNMVVARFSLAVNRRFVKQGEERQADFFNIVSWGKTAEFCSKYFGKGQQIALVGRLQNRNWQDEAGQTHYITEVVAEEVFFADSKKNNGDEIDYNNLPEGTRIVDEFETAQGDDLPF